MMRVPETAVDVDDFAKLTKNDVGIAGKGADVQTIPIAEAIDRAANDGFGPRVLRLDRRHDARSLCLAERVHGVPNLGPNRPFAIIAGIMTSEQIESLKRHFLEWSGGFEPDSKHQITVYVDDAHDSDLDENEVRRELIDWMEGYVGHSNDVDYEG